MRLQPWDYWQADAVTWKDRGADIVATPAGVMDLSSDHPAAQQLQIQAMVATAEPGRAEAAADRLAGSVPSAGHLVQILAKVATLDY